MSGKTKTVSQPNYLPEEQALRSSRAQLLERQLPAMEELTSGVFAGDPAASTPFISPTLRRLHALIASGDDRALDPYVRTVGAPYAAATQRSGEDILRRTPATGGMLSQLLAQNALQGNIAQAQAEGQTRGGLAQQILQSLMAQESQIPQTILKSLLQMLAGQETQPGTTQTQTSDPGATGYLTTAANLGTAGAAIYTAAVL